VNGQSKAAERYTVGPLAHMLKIRMYVGEVAYRGEVHKGQHPPIIDREVFDRVQAMLAERSVARTIKRRNSPHLLIGLGNPMSPTHTNKMGVRYRYYTSHALLQRRMEHAGSVPRVPAPEVEALVCEALRREKSSCNKELSDKDLVAQAVSKVVVSRDRIEVEIRENAHPEEPGDRSKVAIPFSPTASAQKGITREAAEEGHIHAMAREKLLHAIRRASSWVEAVRSGEAKSFAEIAAQEGLGERHVRWLTPLAFLAPQLFSAILNSSASEPPTVASLAKALPHSWAAQKDMHGSKVSFAKPSAL
jgi:site-specific DNA recombinase